MINRKKYIAISKNNLKRSRSILNSRPSNFKTKNDLNNQISINKKGNRQFKSFKIHGTLKEETIAAFDDGSDSLINENTFVNILVQDITTGDSMAGTFTGLQNLRDNELKTLLLPFYGNNESLYNSNVTVRNFDSINNSGTNSLAAGGPSDDLNQITARKNSIALGGLNMVDSSKNVVNMMFQDVMAGNSFNDGGTYPDDYDGEPADDGSAGYAGSIGFLKQGLDFKSNNRAVFFQIGSGTGTGQYVVGSLGLVWKQTLQELQTSLVDTVYQDKTDFNYDIFKGQNKDDYETANPGQNYYSSVIIDALNRIAPS